MMMLPGDDNTPSMPMTDAEVNHLRRLLAWLRCEYTLDPDMQRGYLIGASEAVRHGFASEERASALVQEKAEQINRCPAYIRQAVKMLTKALREHERGAGIIDADNAPTSPERAATQAPCARARTALARGIVSGEAGETPKVARPEGQEPGGDSHAPGEDPC
jgi:hypothetical protein